MGTIQISRLVAGPPPAAGGIIQVSRIVASSAVAASKTVSPYELVSLSPDSIQTSGIAVTPPNFLAPATKDGTVLTFSSSTGGITLTVRSHATWMLGSGGVPKPLNILLKPLIATTATVTGAFTGAGTLSATVSSRSRLPSSTLYPSATLYPSP